AHAHARSIAQESVLPAGGSRKNGAALPCLARILRPATAAHPDTLGASRSGHPACPAALGRGRLHTVALPHGHRLFQTAGAAADARRVGLAPAPATIWFPI